MDSALSSEEWTSVHDRVMTQACGQTDPAPEFIGAWVAIEWPACGSERLGLTASRAGATPYHLTATR